MNLKLWNPFNLETSNFCPFFLENANFPQFLPTFRVFWTRSSERYASGGHFGTLVRGVGLICRVLDFLQHAGFTSGVFRWTVSYTRPLHYDWTAAWALSDGNRSLYKSCSILVAVCWNFLDISLTWVSFQRKKLNIFVFHGKGRKRGFHCCARLYQSIREGYPQ